MMQESPYYLAIDIGASSGRHILGRVHNGKLELEEMYRFENGMEKKNGTLCWDYDKLFGHILEGLRRCGEAGKAPVCLGIDTWGVDFVLLDEQDNVLGDTVAYRDKRNNGMDALVERDIAPQELYSRTGIQKQVFNTIYQLRAIQVQQPELLQRAKRLLMTPEYFNFLLTGIKQSEYTICSTTGLLNAQAKDWDREIISRLGYPQELFGPISRPGSVLGPLSPQVAGQVGFSCQVALPCCHDTASAVLAAPVEDGSVYLSSGTWSLMGVERRQPDCSEESYALNFANEGGFDYRYRFLKNIMGLWMIQSCRKELPEKKSFDELCTLARQAQGFSSRVEVDDPSFMAPENMTQAIGDYCRRTGQQPPQTEGELFRCIYHSLARSYRRVVGEIERVTGKECGAIHIVGGGSKDEYLNRLTAQITGKTVYAGPVEATAIGNLLAQMISRGIFAGVEQARKAVMDSFAIIRVDP